MHSKRIGYFAVMGSAAVLYLTVAGCDWGGEKRVSVEMHGPHGGHLMTLSESTDFAMEFTVDEKRQKLVVYVHEKKSRNPFPLDVDELTATFSASDQSFEVTFAAEPRPSDPDGTSSRFTLDLDQLPQQMIGSNQFELQLTYSFLGKTITGSISHENDHSHDYSHD